MVQMKGLFLHVMTRMLWPLCESRGHGAHHMADSGVAVSTHVQRRASLSLTLLPRQAR